MTTLGARFNALWPRYSIGVSAALLVLIPGLAWGLGLNLGNAILWATGVVLLAYTIETQGMRREIIRQNEIAVQPLLIAGVEERPAEPGSIARYKWQIVLRNIGRGPALRIQLREIELHPDEGMGRFVAKFETVDFLEAGKDAVVKATARLEGEGGEGIIGDLIASLNPRSANETYDVTIAYEDVGGQKWECVVRLGKGGIRLLNHKRA